jgi:hypothetical protein
MTAHLATRDGILCDTPARWPARSGHLDDVSCSRCGSRLTTTKVREDEAAFLRGQERRYREACEAVGVAHLWRAVEGSTDPTGRMLRNILGAVAVAFDELGVQR